MRAGVELFSRLLEFGTVCRSKQAVVTDAGKVVWQDVLQETLQECLPRHASRLDLSAFSVAILKGYGLLVAVDDLVVFDGGLVGIPGEVFEAVQAVVLGLAVDAPVHFPDLCGDGAEQRRIASFECLVEFGPIDFRKRLVRQEVVRVFGRLPRSVGSQSASGDHKVHVRVVIELPGPGVQQGNESGQSAQVLGVGGELEQGRLGAGKEQVVAELLVGAEDLAQLPGHGEGHHEIWARQQFFDLTAQPLVGFIAAAAGAGAVIAGVVGQVLFAAIGALILLGPVGVGAAMHDRRDGLEVGWGHGRSMALEVGGSKPAENLRQHAPARIRAPAARAWVGLGVHARNPLELGHHRLDAFEVLRTGHVGEMCVEGGGLRRGVAQQRLNLTQVHSGLQQVRGVGVTQRVHRDALVDPGRFDRQGQRPLQRPAADRLDRLPALGAPAARSREEQFPVAVRAPVVTHAGEQVRRQGNVARLAPLGLTQMQFAAFLVDTLGAQAQRFTQAQAASIDQLQAA